MRRFFYLLLLVSSFVMAQQKDTYAVEASFLRGNTLPHGDDIHQLVNGHPEGLLFSFVIKTHGKEEWQRVYDFPDYGGYFLYQDFKSEPLGVCYAAGGFYNFYFLNRHLQLELPQNIVVYHRGSNDIIINPIQIVTGVLNSKGNLVLKNLPPVHTPLDVFYTGYVIFS
jgi:hypothetical protein